MPEIRFTTNVASLGREDISAPGRLAAARIQTAATMTQGVLEIERAVSAAQYTKQMSQARNSINELYDSVVSQESFMSSEIPEYVSGFERYEEEVGPDGQMVIVERRIPASEIREQWFRQGMLNITNAAVKGSSAPTARSRISQELRTSIGPAAYNQLLTYNREAAKKERLATLDAAVQDSVINGDRLEMERVLFRFFAAGEISKGDYESRKLGASQDLDIEAYSQEITQASDVSDLDNIWEDMNLGLSPTKPGNEQSDMTPQQRRQLRAHINSQRTVFERAKTEAVLETEREGTRILIAGGNVAVWADRMLAKGDIERPAAMALISAAASGAGGRAKRPAVIGAYQSKILNDIISPEFGTQVSDIRIQWQKDINADTFINGEEKEELFEYVASIENNLTNNPRYRQAAKTISAVTGVPEDMSTRQIAREKARGNFAIQEAAYNDFMTGLVNYVDEFGVEGDPMDWVNRNSNRYNRVDKENTLFNRVNQAFPELMITGENITDQNRDAVMAEAYGLYFRPGERSSEEKLFDLWQMLYDTSIDLSEWENLQ